jgi:hypothetical protein
MINSVRAARGVGDHTILYTPYGYLVNGYGGAGDRVSHSCEGRSVRLAWAT